MADHASFKMNMGILDSFSDFQKSIRKDLIENGLDDPIKDSLFELGERLKYYIREEIRNIEPIAPDELLKTTTKLDQPIINRPKSETDIVEFITGINPTNTNTAQDFADFKEKGMIFGHHSRNVDGNNRVTLRMEIGPYDTFEEHLAQARKFFQNALFGFENERGEVEYFQNTGVDLTPYVKIKCSTVVGSGSNIKDFYDKRGRKGMSPKERFERDKKKGYAEWTIKQDMVDRIRTDKSNLINITPMIKEAQAGNTEEAIKIFEHYKKTTPSTKVVEEKEEEILNKLERLDKQENLTPSVEAYTNLNRLIDNLDIKKTISGNKVLYELISSYHDFDEKEDDFYVEIQRHVRFWTETNADYWYDKFVTLAEQIINKFKR